MKPCDYCPKRSTYSCGAHLEKEVVDIQACDDHVGIALCRQQGLMSMERLRQSMSLRHYPTYKGIV